MNELPDNPICFAEFELDTVRRQLWRDGEIVALHSKAFDLLAFLVQNNGRLVSKDEILDTVWENNFVEESNLLVQISNLRKALGETKNSPRFLITIPGKGYKFIAPVEDELIIETHSVAELTIEEISPEHLALPEKQTSTFPRWAIAAAVLLICLIGFFAYRHYSEPPKNDLTSTASVSSIAVLPFQFIQSEAQNEGLELGLTESLINRLSSLKNVSIRPLSAVKKYTPENRDFSKIGNELKVDSVLEGNIQTVGNRIRLTCRLLNTKTGETIWNEQIDEDFTEIFTVQDKISNRIISSLQIALSEKEKSRFAKNEKQNIEAYKKYLTARYHWNKRNAEGFYESIKFYKESLDLDPTFALAYSGIADSYLLIGLYGIEPTTDAFPKAQAAAEKALEINPESAEAFVSLAMVNYLFRYDWKKAEEDFRLAIDLKPSYSTGHHWFGLFLAMNDRTDEALKHLSHAKELDPLSSSINTDVAFAYYLGNQFDQAIGQLEKTLKSNPDFPNALNHLGMNLVAAKRYDEAITQFEKAKQISNGRAGTTESIWANGFAGNKEKARQLLAGLPKNEKFSPFDLAVIYASLDEKEKAIEYLEEAYQKRSPLLVPLKVFPPFESLRNEPKFIELLKKMNLA
jgi:DNA-binding winged helix-turn-helix (wHTH) protein/TolB-like protein/Flp pilus assembly protein TadD